MNENEQIAKMFETMFTDYITHMAFEQKMPQQEFDSIYEHIHNAFLSGAVAGIIAEQTFNKHTIAQPSLN